MMPDDDPMSFDPPVGMAQVVAPGVRRILAPNPSAMTFRGTNTYIVGQGAVAVIDPGPADPMHLSAILDALPGERITHILVTHAHLDHSPLAADLSRRTGAPVLGFGNATAGRSAVMHRLAASGLAGGGEGVDGAFCPDVRLSDGASVQGRGWTLRALHTPGHMGNHLCFAFGTGVFAGDLVMGWSTSLISPPDGDMGAFIASCRRVQGARAAVLWPAHGAPVHDPAARIDALIAHRMAREAQILSSLGTTPRSLNQITAAAYTDIAQNLLPAARRNVLAHLIDLASKNIVLATPELSESAQFTRREN